MLERELLAAARAGSNEALGQVLMACRPYLLLVANKELDADLQGKLNPSDIVQETFLEAQRDFQQFTGESEEELVAWLRQILLHNLANVSRSYRATGKRSLERELSLDGSKAASALAHGLTTDTPSPSEHALANEQAEQVEKALARLPEHYQQVIRLRHREAKSFVDIGVALNCSTAAARKLWLRAIDQLQQELRPPS